MRIAELRLTRTRWIARALLLVAVATLALVLPVYWVYLLSSVAIGALIAAGIGVVTNRAGLVTLCQMSFAAIGGWVVSWFAIAWPGAPFPVLVLLGGVAAAPVGLLLGAATARIRGIELAVVTLGLATALDLVLRQGSFPGTGEGRAVLPAAPFDDPRWSLALCWGLLVLLQLGLAVIGRTSLGPGWAAVRSSERAAAALGMRVGAAKAGAFAVGVLFAGVAGGLLAGQYGLLTTQVFTPLASMVHLATAVLCGAGVFGGAVLAGALSAFMPEVLRRLGLPLDLGYALLALGAFDVLRRGGGGLMEQLEDRFEDRAFRRVRTGCEIPPGAGLGDPGSARRGPSGRGAAAAPPRLEVAGLTVSHGGQAVLDSVDLCLERGEVLALIGPNGAGKTTLVDAVTGFLPEYAGAIRFDGAAIDGLDARQRARLGLRRTFQRSRAVEALGVGDYLRLAAGGGTGAARSERIARAREFLGLPGNGVPIRLMDVGSRRVLEVAAALASGPRVVLLDEPAAGLGEVERSALAERVRRIPAEFGCAVLLIEHDMGFVRAAAGRAVVLDEGRVIANGPLARVFDAPGVIAAYLGREAAGR